MTAAETTTTATATVYQLHRGNHRSDPDGMAAEAIRHAVRIEDSIELTKAEFDRFYDEVGVEEIEYEDADTEEILGAVWQRWNRGSGAESRTFIDAKTRSLEVGDIVEIAGMYHLVEPIGWDEIQFGAGGGSN